LLAARLPSERGTERDDREFAGVGPSAVRQCHRGRCLEAGERAKAGGWDCWGLSLCGNN